MSTALEERQAIIAENLPKLIKLLTGFEETDENFLICEQFALSIIKHHRNISVNSHEIRRQMEGLFDKFCFDNYSGYAAKLRSIFEDFINDPLCKDHYEVDIQWSILKFLLELAHNPVGNLSEKLIAGEQILLDPTAFAEVPAIDVEKENLVKLLKDDNIQFERNLRNYGDTNDSDLSDWSDIDEDIVSNSSQPITSSSANDQNSEIAEIESVVKVFTEVHPPVKSPHFKLFDTSKSAEWLDDNIQHSWWTNPDAICKINSFHEGASFCEFWNQHLATISHNFIKADQISTISEYCLLREVLFMFVEATNCKFFRLEDDEVLLNANVSIPSTTMKGIQVFLGQITPYMTIMHRLRKFCKIVLGGYGGNSTFPPHTFESYASAIEDYLNTIIEFIVGQESAIHEQKEQESFTLVLLYNNFGRYFDVLKNLWDIHTHSVLDWNKFPAHICSSHLLAGIFSRIRNSANSMKSNMALSIYLNTIRVYMMILDVWFTEGRLDDWRAEYLVEKVIDSDTNATTGFCARQLRSSKEKSFYLNEKISRAIEADPIIKLLLQHSVDAGFTLNILANLDRINELKNKSTESLYNLLFQSIVAEFDKLRTNSQDDSENQSPENENESEQSAKTESTPNQMIAQKLRKEILEMGDELLLMAFESSLQIAERQGAPNQNTETPSSLAKNRLNAYHLYENLNSITDLMLPAENFISRILLNILEVKISSANKFVRTIYKDEYHVLTHLQTIRKVLLLEASGMMHYFYTKLFKQIENGDDWANPYLLTVQLNDIWSSYFQHSFGQALFSIDITTDYNCDTTKVLNAIDKITINYNITNHLSNVINAASLSCYNKIFRFLVKVKWGLWTLENLRFPDIYRKRRPYAELEMIDLLLRRLALLRFWMIHAIQCVHSHLMTQVLQALGSQLDVNIEKASNLSEMIGTHKSYIATVYDHCFQNVEEKNILEGILQLLNLCHVMRDEWNNTCLLNVMDESGHITDVEHLNDFIESSQVDAIEKTYTSCHKYLVETLNREVYHKHKAHLAGLYAAFSSGVPY